MKKFSLSLERTDKAQYFLAFLLLVVYIGTLFFPLMDKDAARHANVALNMYETGEFWKLIERNTNYLDKPHFLFWISFLSYKVFGVNTFAVRLPHILYAIIAVYSIYRLALHLTDKTTAKLSAIVLATAQAFVLAIMDARMETPLTAGIAFGLWQLITYIDHIRLRNLVFAALGFAVAFSTKGWVGPIMIAFGCFFYLLFTKNWAVLLKPKTWVLVPAFLLFIFPVVYSYYLQFDLHPEIVVRGTTGHSGVKFILWNQNFERFQGENFAPGEGGGRNKDYFFLYHTFLWAFFPWSLPACAAVVFWTRRFVALRKWTYPLSFAPAAFVVALFLISFSKFKMPHYIIMLFPYAALMTAPYLRLALSYRRPFRVYRVLYTVLAVLAIVVIFLLNYYFFKPANFFVQIAAPLLVLLFVYSLLARHRVPAKKLLYNIAGLSLLLNFFFNYNFFPNLMRYQAGNVMAAAMKEEKPAIPDSSIRLLEIHAHTFDFYRGYNHDIVSMDSLTRNHQQFRNAYFLLSRSWVQPLKDAGFTIVPVIARPDYNVSTVDLMFLNPKTRNAKLDTLTLAKVYKP